LQASELKIGWRQKASDDLQRLYDFLMQHNASTALQTVESLLQAVRKLRIHPRLGARLANFRNREVRKLHIGSYELRYELKEDRIIILRFWHGRENR
jgi:plasmid stabilization system protein ParE